MGALDRKPTHVDTVRELKARIATLEKKQLARALDGQVIATGTIGMSATSAVPAGWVAADGSAITAGGGNDDLRQALIDDGSPHGSDGSGNPKVPNLNGGKFPRGSSSPGGTGGASTHAHSASGDVGNFNVNISAPALGFVYASGAGGHVHPAADHTPPYVDVFYLVKL